MLLASVSELSRLAELSCRLVTRSRLYHGLVVEYGPVRADREKDIDSLATPLENSVDPGLLATSRRERRKRATRTLDMLERQRHGESAVMIASNRPLTQSSSRSDC